jgi:hypothetical protein
VASAETNETLRWHDPAWLFEATAWIDERLRRLVELCG